MRGSDDLHFEPFLHLAGLDDDQALIAWGGFWFRPFADGRGWRIVDDEQLADVEPGRNESIGAASAPYGEAVVDVFGSDGERVATAGTDDANHVWITGLDAGTEYRYEVSVAGRRWAPDECMRWQRIDGARGELVPAGHTYDCRFRTFPSPGSERLRFAALGDYGIGIQTSDPNGGHQRRLARTLERLVDEGAVDLVVTLGDNIYHEETESIGGSGAEDDDWYFSFYEPYRFVINRVPVYPAVGNHDAAETEASDDRDQLADNHFTDLRFSPDVEADRSSVRVEGGETSGLFYRFSWSDLVEFVCVDTSEASAFETDRFFDEPEHLPFLEEAFDPERTDRRRWTIPFGHHPPYCAGPKHHNDEDQIGSLVPRYRRAGVRLVLAGHEHNFQHAIQDDVHYVVCGAGGKLREGEPDGVVAAGTRSWAARPHLLLAEVDRQRIRLLPVDGVDAVGRPVPIEVCGVDGEVELPIVIAGTEGGTWFA